MQKIEGIGHMASLKKLVLDNNRLTRHSGLDYLK